MNSQIVALTRSLLDRYGVFSISETRELCPAITRTFYVGTHVNQEIWRSKAHSLYLEHTYLVSSCARDDSL